jgi:hypothetical protein
MTTQKTLNETHRTLYARRNARTGAVLPFVIMAVVILAALAVGLMMASFGVRMQSVRVKNETAAMLAAEAGYEQGIFWMSQQPDIIGALEDGNSGSIGTIDFDGSSCSYQVDFDDYIGARPVFRIVSKGQSGISSRVVDVAVIQAVTGWVMGKCRIPNGTNSTNAVNFAEGEIIDIPIHINNLKDSPDARDIYIDGNPTFKRNVDMGESRETTSNTDKYSTVMGLFHDGIDFDQPNVRITDEAAVQSKVNRFRDSTDPLFRFTPVGTANVTRPHSAVQLEFFVDSGIGKVKITNNCTVRGFAGNDNDYNIVAGSHGTTYQKYDIYAYHYAPRNLVPLIVPVEDTYVRQHFGTKESAPGGQIFVDGDVVIGGASTTSPDMIVKGTMTIVATGNIWIADSIVVDGAHGADANGMPSEGNPNVIGLIAQGVIKVVDPGMSNKASSNPPPPALEVHDRLIFANMHDYKPIANADTGVINNRKLPHNMVVEAAITIGGGGWGAENVLASGGRKVTGPGNQDYIVVKGTLSECIRGIVGIIGSNGYLKRYYLDKRLLEGILPGDIWFGGKYVPAPAGWQDYRPDN